MREARDDLKPALEVQRPAERGRHDERVLPLDAAGRSHAFDVAVERLDEEVEGRARQPDDARSRIRGERPRSLADVVSRTWNPGGAEVDVADELRGDDHARGERQLDSPAAGAEAPLFFSRGRKEGEARSDRQRRVAVAQELIAIVESQVSRPACAAVSRDLLDRQGE